MGWYGKVMGAAVGGVLGGPIGAALGAGLGAGVDSMFSGDEPARTQPSEPPPPPDLDCSANYVDDAVGRSILVQFHAQLPANTQLLISLLDGSGTHVKADAAYADEDGDLFLVRPVVGGSVRFYVPFGRLHLTMAGEHSLLLTAVHERAPEDYAVIGRTSFNVPYPSPQAFDKIAFIAPLIELCMHVVTADGKILPQEIQLVKARLTEAFELTPAELPGMRDLMKQTPRPIPELLDSIHFRMPGVDAAGIIELLAEVAHADENVAPEEVAVIKAVAMEYGCNNDQWQLLVDEHKLHVVDHHAVLGIAPTAAPSEVQAAYKRLVAQYHPDRVASLPREFQELAHQKMKEINAAYAALKPA